MKSKLQMDEIDVKLIRLLSENARQTWADLATELGLSRPAIAERVKKLEEKGIINGYTVKVNPKAFGIHLTAFIFVILNNYSKKEEFFEIVNDIHEVMEAHHIAGNDDFILKVRCKSIEDLDDLICNKFKQLDIVDKTRTNVVLSTDKDISMLPLCLEKVTELP